VSCYNNFSKKELEPQNKSHFWFWRYTNSTPFQPQKTLAAKYHSILCQLHIPSFPTNNWSKFQNLNYSWSQLWRSMQKLWDWHLFTHHNDCRNVDQHRAMKIKWIYNSTAILVFSCLSYIRVCLRIVSQFKMVRPTEQCLWTKLSMNLGKTTLETRNITGSIWGWCMKPWNNI
jgi:hypothetical protein